MADDTRSVTVDSKGRVSLGDLVEPGQRWGAWSSDGQIIMAPVVEVVRTAENAEVLDQIGAFLKDPSTGVRRGRPQRRTQADRCVGQGLAHAGQAEADAVHVTRTVDEVVGFIHQQRQFPTL